VHVRQPSGLCGTEDGADVLSRAQVIQDEAQRRGRHRRRELVQRTVVVAQPHVTRRARLTQSRSDVPGDGGRSVRPLGIGKRGPVPGVYEGRVRTQGGGADMRFCLEQVVHVHALRLQRRVQPCPSV